MEDKVFDIGDEVYVFKDDLLKSFKTGKLIKGIIINRDNHDYGYHGSGDWIWDYIIKGIDGEDYYANHGYGYKEYQILTKEEVIEAIKSLMAYKEEVKENIRYELSEEAILDYVHKYMKSKRKSFRETISDIRDLNDILESFTSNETKGRQRTKGTR